MEIQRTRWVPLYAVALLLAITALLGYAEGVAKAEAPIPLTLSQAIDLALKQNRSLRLARLSVSVNEERKEIAHSSYFPHIKNDSSVLHITELAGVEIPAGAFGVFSGQGQIPRKSIHIDQGAATSYTSGTQLTQPLSQMFKIREANRAAQADLNGAKIQVSQAEEEVALKTRQLYFQLLVTQLKLEAANQEKDSRQLKEVESHDAVERGRALEVASMEAHAARLESEQTVLALSLSLHDGMLELNDLLGLPLNTVLKLDPEISGAMSDLPLREEAIGVARRNSNSILAAQQLVLKAKAGLGAAKDEYIPDITGMARYSYQSGVPLLVHNFGSFGFNFSYDLFDGGRRNAEIKEARTLLNQAQLSLEKTEEEVSVQVESAYDKIDQLENLVRVAEEALQVRVEAARIADRQLEQNAVLSSVQSEAHAKVASSRASLIEAKCGLSLAQADLKRTLGAIPR